MKKKNIIIAAVAAVLVIGGIAVSTNQDMLQGKLGNVTRSGGFQAPTQSMDVKPFSGSTSSSESSGGLDTEDLSSVVLQMEGYLDEAEDYFDETSEFYDELETMVNDYYGLDTDELESHYDDVLAASAAVESKYNAAVRAQEYIFDQTQSSGALSVNYRTQADDLLEDIEDYKNEAMTLRSNASDYRNEYSNTEGDLEITDVTAFTSSTELVLNVDIVNNPNSLKAGSTRNVIPGTVAYTGVISSGKELITFSGSKTSKTNIGPGETETLTLYLDDDEANSWLVNKVLSGASVDVELAIEVDTKDEVAESDERNNRYTTSLSL